MHRLLDAARAAVPKMEPPLAVPGRLPPAGVDVRTNVSSVSRTGPPMLVFFGPLGWQYLAIVSADASLISTTRPAAWRASDLFMRLVKPLTDAKCWSNRLQASSTAREDVWAPGW